ncbi:hypothetical protein BK126_14805 [Paenibacillus sp. FSL H7-0326]|uniref:FtsW/RodA/SpoVE family cell cycle protein n=1 Tax=Paenibacillus sp. FSL H7-0326 TaxID=1921144 RepID=UPI00096F80F8|nr:FtsW/RodA/SpoVE family cell cycle protein [Paenibacillus sp. FSL H7-0326]OMC69050.1 hypothetical protein BK126_14805 [Paenibacillus sp. FSL H7-0326]
MREIDQHHAVKEFLDQVCSQVRAKRMHTDIRDELKNHIEERMEDLQQEGYSVDISAEAAIKEMGTPLQIGKSLDQAHRPSTDWKLILLIFMFTAMGLFAAFNAQSMALSSPLFADHLIRTAFHTVIGLIFFICFYFIQYLIFKNYSQFIFTTTLFLMAFAIGFGIQVNGMRGYLALGFFSFNIMYISVPILLFGLAGMKPAREWSKRETLTQMIYRGVIPAALYVTSGSVTSLMLYLLGFLVLTWTTRKSVQQFAIFALLSLVAAASYLYFHADYMVARFQTYLNPTGEGAHVTGITIEAIRSAGWFGHGFAAINTSLPYIHNDSILTYLFYCYGWSFALVLGLFITLLLHRMWTLQKSIRDSYGKLIVTLVVFYFGIRLVWSLLSAIGFLPMISINIPFIGYGGTAQIVDLAAIGLLLSVYRYKNMIPSLSESISLPMK